MPSKLKEINARFPAVDVPRGAPVMGIERFIGTYLSHYLEDEVGNAVKSPHFHREIYYVLSNPKKYRKVIVVAPRGFAKSAIFEFFGNMYDAVVTKRYKEILIIGSCQDFAESWLRKIKTEILNNELIYRDFGELANADDKSEKWASDIITLKNGVTIVARGYEGKMRGLHPNKIVIDDLETDESARSKDQCRKIEMWLKQTVLPMQRSMRSVIQWVGTFLSNDSVLKRAYDGKGWDDSWYRMKYGAYEEGATEKSIWPEAFPEEFLRMRRREMGLYAFASEYLNEPIGSLDPVIKKYWINYYTQDQLPPSLYRVLGVDPAISSRQLADESALVLLGADAHPHKPTNQIFCLQEHAGRYDKHSLIKLIFEWCYKYHPNEVVIEATSFQQSLVEDFEREAHEQGFHVTITPVKPSTDKVTRLKDVTPFFERGELFFKEDQDSLIQQLLAFPDADHDDRVDALVHGLFTLKGRWHTIERAYRDRYEPDESHEAIPEVGLF